MVRDEQTFRLCIGQKRPSSVSETFLQHHQQRLPCDVTMIYNEESHRHWRANKQKYASRIGRQLRKKIGRHPKWSETTEMYYQVMRQVRPHALLAEYGFTGVLAKDACVALDVPFVVHFHGYDAWRGSLLAVYGALYKEMFGAAAAVIGVSRHMCRRLSALGAPEDKIHYVPYGVDCDAFSPNGPLHRPPVFVAVGRFVDKKSPHLTLKAFSEVLKVVPEARLILIGDGPLESVCIDLAKLWNVSHAVTFMGAQPHSAVQECFRSSTCFVQHSVVARTGDCEGTPNAIIEAGAAGLPVIATRHAGIPDVVVDGETGVLVDEGDVQAMADHMTAIAQDPKLAASLGAAARRRIETEFDIRRSISKLWAVIRHSAAGTPLPSETTWTLNGHT